MSGFRVEKKHLDSVNEQISGVSKEIYSIKNQIEDVLRQMNMQSSSYASVRRNLDAAVSASNTQAEKVRRLSAALNQIADIYAQTESRLTDGTGLPNTTIEKAVGNIRNALDSVSGSLGMDPAAMYSDDPVNLSNGNYVYEKSFFEYDTIIPMAFRMFYNVGGDRSGVLGRGWLHSFEKAALIEENAVRVINEDGSEQLFRRVDSGFSAVPGTVGALMETDSGYQYTDDEHISFFFNKSGKLIKEETMDGWSIELEHVNGRLYRAFCTDGIELAFSYDEEDHLTGITDSANRTVAFRFDGDRLAEVCDPNGNVTAYEYDEKGRLCRIVSPTGDLSVQNTYDERGRTLRQEFADGGVVAYQYNDKDQNIVMRRQNGSEVTYYHDTLFRNTRTVYPTGEELVEYNSENQRIAFTDKLGRTSRYKYDAGGRLAAFKNPAGNELTFGYNLLGQLAEVSIDGDLLGRAEYDSHGHQVRHTDACGGAVELKYDSLGRLIWVKHEDESVTELTYDEYGNVVRVVEPVTGTTCYEYDVCRRVICSTDALGNKTHYEYDALDQLLKVTNADGQSRRYEYDARGNLVKVVDFNGGVLIIRYNAMNKPVEITNADGNTTAFEYDQMSNPIRKITADGGVTEYGYDTENRMTSIRHPMGGVETAEYDAVGNLIKRRAADGGEYVIAYDVLDRPISVTDPVNGTRSATYDKLGNVTDIQYEDGSSEHFTFDLQGNRLSHTDQTGYTRFFKYNALRLVTEITDAQGVLAAFSYGPGGQLCSERHMGGASLTYRYNEAGNVIEVIDSVRGVWHFQYDALNRVIRAEHVGDGVESYEYDAIGNIKSVIDGEGCKTKYGYSKAGALVSVTDPLGNETRYQYDPCYRLKEILQPESGHFDAEALNEFNRGQQLRITSYQWDLDGNMIAETDSASGRLEFNYDGCGRMISKKDQEGNVTTCTYRVDGTEEILTFADGRTVKYEYDALKRLSQIEDWLGITRIGRDAAGRVVEVTEYDGARTSYQWDERGKCIRLSYPDGSSAQYGYDKAGRLACVGMGDMQVAYDYFDNGQLRRRSFSGGVHTDYAYDSAGRIASLTHCRGGEVQTRFSYEYDACSRKNRIIERVGAAPEEDYRFSYDLRGSLLNVLRNGKMLQSFEYDVFGNRTKMAADGQETEYGYDVMNRMQWRMSRGEKRTYTYDRRGNMTGEAVNGVNRLTMHFDALNRLAKASSDLGEAEYQYNGMAALARINRIMGGERGETRYQFDPTEQNHLLATMQDGKWENYIWDSQLLGVSSSGGQSILLTDERMSNRFAVDKKGTQFFKYDVFGNFNRENDIRLTASAFAGYRYDPITGYYDTGWRQYDAVNGRFISQDPIAGGLMTPITLNPYLYCLSDPVNVVDPTGMILAWLAGGIVGTVMNVGAKFAGDVVNSVKNGKWSGSSWESYVGAAAGGFVEGSVFAVAGPTAAGAAGAATESLVTGGLSMATGREGYRKEDGYGFGKLLTDTAISGAKGAVAGFTWGKAAKYIKIPGITSGRGNFSAVWKQVMTKAQRGIIANVTKKTLYKGLVSYGIVKTVDGIISKGYDAIKDEAKKFVKNKATDLIDGSFKKGAGVSPAVPASLGGLLGGAKTAICATA